MVIGPCTSDFTVLTTGKLHFEVLIQIYIGLRMKRKTTNLDKLHADASISMEGMVKRTLSLFGTGIHVPLGSHTSRCQLVRYSNLVRESLVRYTNVSHCEPREI